MKLQDALVEYLRELKTNECTQQTLVAYRGKLQFFINNVAVEDLESVTPIHIKHYIKKRQEANVKATSINTELRIISGMFKYFIEFYEGEIIEKNPLDKSKVKKLKETKKVMKAFSENDIDKLLKLFNGKRFYDIRNKTIIMVFLDTGIRMEELLKIRMEDVYDHSRIKIHGKGNKERFVPISRELRRQLLKYEKARLKFLEDEECSAYFVSKHKKELGYRGLKQLAVAINETVEIEGCFHNFRRYYAQNMYKETKDIYAVMRLLGHSNIAVTQRYIQSIEDTEILEIGMDSPLMRR
jgi:integrase/recombinase XerD